MTTEDSVMILRLKHIKAGETIVYFTGPANNRAGCPVFACAYELARRRKLVLHQRRIRPPTCHGYPDHRHGVGSFEYIAIGA